MIVNAQNGLLRSWHNPSLQLAVTYFDVRWVIQVAKNDVMGEVSSLYNQYMARGWDSKAVEDQIQSAEISTVTLKKPTKKSEQELARVRTRQGLELMRSRVKQQMDRAQNERYREMLHKELTALDQQLSDLA